MWHRGHARSLQIEPFESIAFPAISNRVGRNRIGSYSPKFASPIKLGWVAIHKIFSGAKRLQQVGHIMGLFSATRCTEAGAVIGIKL